MPSVVLDASVVVDLVAPTVSLSSSAGRTVRRLARQGFDLLAPRLLLAECANALLTGVKRARWSGAAADLAFAELGRMPVRFADDVAHLERAWELSRRYDNRPVYDMIYVAVAERAGVPLITADQTLRQRLSHLAWIAAPDA